MGWSWTGIGVGCAFEGNGRHGSLNRESCGLQSLALHTIRQTDDWIGSSMVFY
jgi:hypothetical protein